MDQDDQNQNQQEQPDQAYNPAQDEPVQPLPQDGDTPAAPAPDVDNDTVGTDNPAADTGVQAEEVYDEGEGGSAEDGGDENTQPPIANPL